MMEQFICNLNILLKLTRTGEINKTINLNTKNENFKIKLEFYI